MKKSELLDAFDEKGKLKQDQVNASETLEVFEKKKVNKVAGKGKMLVVGLLSAMLGLGVIDEAAGVQNNVKGTANQKAANRGKGGVAVGGTVNAFGIGGDKRTVFEGGDHNIDGSLFGFGGVASGTVALMSNRDHGQAAVAGTSAKIATSFIADDSYMDVAGGVSVGAFVPLGRRVGLGIDLSADVGTSIDFKYNNTPFVRFDPNAQISFKLDDKNMLSAGVGYVLGRKFSDPQLYGGTHGFIGYTRTIGTTSGASSTYTPWRPSVHAGVRFSGGAGHLTTTR
jgi:hypothetical protein